MYKIVQVVDQMKGLAKMNIFLKITYLCCHIFYIYVFVSSKWSPKNIVLLLYLDIFVVKGNYIICENARKQY